MILKLNINLTRLQTLEGLTSIHRSSLHQVQTTGAGNPHTARIIKTATRLTHSAVLLQCFQRLNVELQPGAESGASARSNGRPTGRSPRLTFYVEGSPALHPTQPDRDAARRGAWCSGAGRAGWTEQPLGTHQASNAAAFAVSGV